MTPPRDRRLTHTRVTELKTEIAHLEGRLDEFARELRDLREGRDSFGERLAHEIGTAALRTLRAPARAQTTTEGAR